MFFVVTESNEKEGEWEQLSTKFKTYEEAMKFKEEKLDKKKYPNAFIVCFISDEW